jgi:hypothetical protein
MHLTKFSRTVVKPEDFCPHSFRVHELKMCTALFEPFHHPLPYIEAQKFSEEFLQITDNYSMGLSHSWEANKYTSTKEIQSILWNPKFHHRFHKNSRLILILRHLILFFHIILPFTSRSSVGSLLQGFLQQLCSHSSSFWCLLHASCSSSSLE